MRKICFLLINLLFLQISAQTNYCSKIDDELIIQKTYLSISYNIKYRIPNYVGYVLTAENLKGNVSREQVFYTDDQIPKLYSTSSSDYSNSGYDRGHMSPAADWKGIKEGMHETFSLANICPQKPKLNRLYWNELEKLERNYLKDCDSLFVITGTICNDTQIYIKHKIRVPNFFFKTIVGTKSGKVVLAKAWIYKNSSIKQVSNKCETTFQNIEKLIKGKLYINFWFRKKLNR